MYNLHLPLNRSQTVKAVDKLPKLSIDGLVRGTAQIIEPNGFEHSHPS